MKTMYSHKGLIIQTWHLALTFSWSKLMPLCRRIESLYLLIRIRLYMLESMLSESFCGRSTKGSTVNTVLCWRERLLLFSYLPLPFLPSNPPHIPSSQSPHALPHSLSNWWPIFFDYYCNYIYVCVILFIYICKWINI